MRDEKEVLRDILKELDEIWYLRCTGFGLEAWEKFDKLRAKLVKRLEVIG